MKNTKKTTARRHRSPTSLSGYENMLIAMIEARTGEPFQEFLMAQVMTCAQTMMMSDRVYRELVKMDALVTPHWGVAAQQKDEVTPLLPYYMKLQGELRLQFEALGLNYRATPKKITENTKKGGEEQDRLQAVLDDITKV